jgi:hypothetical protein
MSSMSSNGGGTLSIDVLRALKREAFSSILPKPVQGSDRALRPNLQELSPSTCQCCASKIAFNDANHAVSSFDLGTLVWITAKNTVCAIRRTVIESDVYAVYCTVETSLYADGVSWPNRDGSSEGGFAVAIGTCDVDIMRTVVVIPEY